MKSDSAPAHSKLSPSKAATWTTCTASVRFIRENEHQLPPDKPGDAAIEGTKAHNVAEALLLNKPVPKYATRDMVIHAKAYAEFCRETMGGNGNVIEWGVEKRVPLFYLPEERGTVDFFALTKTGLHMVDFKYGYGEVNSIENKQMAIYAASLLADWANDWLEPRTFSDDMVVTTTIFQPRLSEETTTWKTTVGQLRAFVTTNVLPHAQAILRGDKGVFAPSAEACKFCRAKGICKAYNENLLKDFEHELDDLPAVETLTEAQVLKAYAAIPSLTEWAKAVKEHVEARVKAGYKLPGLKLALSNGGHRYWADEARAGKLLLDLGLAFDEVYPPADVISPAQAEKLTKKHKGQKIVELHGLMKKPAGVPIVVPESDPRPEYVRDFTGDFEDTFEF